MVNKCRCGGSLYTREEYHDQVVYDVRHCNRCKYWACDLVGTPNPLQAETKNVNRRSGNLRKRK